MKLNHDCVRALLLHIEDTLSIGYRITTDDIELSDFDKNDIIYSAIKLLEAGFISGKHSEDMTGNVSVIISGITWEGHKFLDTIRDNKVWNSTKNVLSKVSSASISFASTVASQVLTNIISQSLGVQPTI